MRKRVIGGLVVATLAAAVAALALLVAGAAGDNGNGRHGHGSTNNGQTGYHFLVLDAVSGTSDRMIIDGTGGFNGNKAHGGGSFDHFQAGATLPLHIVASGTWKADDVVSFTASPTSHGPYEGGVLVMHATFFPAGQPAIKNVMVEVDCNLGPIGFSTGKAEGVVVTFPGGPVFAPTNLGPTTPVTGVTVFTVARHDEDQDGD
jgi:hypothetical protein